MPPKAEPYDGYELLADTSAWIEARKRVTPRAAKLRWQAALRNGKILTSPIVRLELYKGGRSADDLQRTDEYLQGAYEELPLTPATTSYAVTTMRDVATPGASGYHQVPVTDLLIAATAKAYRVGVLTCDWNHFCKLADWFAIPLFDLIDPAKKLV